MIVVSGGTFSPVAPYFGALLPEGVMGAVSESSDPDLGFDEERQLVANAIPKRQREFMRGRAAARAALRELGVMAGAILSSADRTPIWPAGVTASITHTNNFVGAVATLAERFDSIGFDAEPLEALSLELLPAICTPAERSWLATTANPLEMAKILFSAKESVQKCVYPLTGRILDFTDVTIGLHAERLSFRANLEPSAAALPEIDQLEGRLHVADDLILTLATLR